MSNLPVRPTTAGHAFRVTVLGAQGASYDNVYAQLDPTHSVIHIFSADAQQHFLTIPTSLTLVEWADSSML